MLKNRREKIFWFIIVFILLIPVISRLLWSLSDNKEMNIVVLDKTVLNKSFQEHLSFNYFLNHAKYTKKEGELYSESLDYYGFFPDGKGKYTINDLEQKSKQELEKLANKSDVVYYTDLYGIYDIEWHNEYPEIAPNKKPGRIGERSKLIYGGLTNKELELLKLMKNKKKLIINEFNIMASPTNSGIRKKYEQEFDIKWENWVGRYFNELDTNVNKELPLWLTKNYMKQNNNEWPFKNSGIVFVRSDDIIIVLENKTHLKVELPYIYTKNNLAKYYKLTKKIKYPFWFDICSVGESNEIVAMYKIKPNAKGDSILKKWDIPKEFPAVIKSKEDYPYYYFAGDFCDNPISMTTSKFKYSEKLEFLFYRKSPRERESFFWRYYLPIMRKIFDDYYQEKVKVER